MKNGKPQLGFDPAAALPINSPRLEFSLRVDMTTGRTSFEQVHGPPLNILAVTDLLATQIQTLMRGALSQGIPDGAGGKDDGKNEDNNHGST